MKSTKYKDEVERVEKIEFHDGKELVSQCFLSNLNQFEQVNQ